MENRVLKYFLIVAREENITRAAEILHISQPALSRQLMQLEEELGAKLFIRGKRNITLTDEGLYLRQKAQEIIDLTERTEQEFANGITSLSGVISIGMGETAASSYIADLIYEFREQYPDVRFEIIAGNADGTKEQLDKGLLDVGILLEPTDFSKYEFVRLPVKDTWGVIVPSKCPLCQKEYVTAEDLKGRQIFISNRAVNQSMFSSWFGENYNPNNIYLTVNLLYNAAMLVSKGMGCAVTIDGAAKLYNHPELNFRPLYPKIEQTSVLVWKKNQIASACVAKFLEFIKCNSVMVSDKK
ncbi:MAG: LysR family transcriptional regulator [Clostridiales bacterium]|nr:LysR family transcriptional regulator [Clostridiales bacterium]